MGKRNKRVMVRACLRRVKLEVAEAADLARIMERQIRAGDIESAFQTGLDIEPHLNRGNDALQAACLFAKPLTGQ